MILQIAVNWWIVWARWIPWEVGEPSNTSWLHTVHTSITHRAHFESTVCTFWEHTVYAVHFENTDFGHFKSTMCTLLEHTVYTLRAHSRKRARAFTAFAGVACAAVSVTCKRQDSHVHVHVIFQSYMLSSICSAMTCWRGGDVWIITFPDTYLEENPATKKLAEDAADGPDVYWVRVMLGAQQDLWGAVVLGHHLLGHRRPGVLLLNPAHHKLSQGLCPGPGVKKGPSNIL